MMSITGDGTQNMPTDGPAFPENTRVEGELRLFLVLSEELTLPVPVRFIYLTADPYAVHLEFYPGTRDPVPWVFARELLLEGMSRPVGSADVRVRHDPVQGLVYLALLCDGETALVQVPVAPLAAWLERTQRLVPYGREGEFVDLDALCEHLLETCQQDEPTGHCENCDPGARGGRRGPGRG